MPATCLPNMCASVAGGLAFGKACMVDERPLWSPLMILVSSNDAKSAKDALEGRLEGRTYPR